MFPKRRLPWRCHCLLVCSGWCVRYCRGAAEVKLWLTPRSRAVVLYTASCKEQEQEQLRGGLAKEIKTNQKQFFITTKKKKTKGVKKVGAQCTKE